MTAINHHIKLTCILTRTIRSIYSINKHKVHYGYVGEEWESTTGTLLRTSTRAPQIERHLVADLDSELNAWINSLPNHREPPVVRQ